MSAPKRIAAVLLSASVVLFSALESSEGFAPVAMKPVPEDRWTYGFGSTYKMDGSPVKPGDTITRPEARKLMEAKVRDHYQPVIVRCLGNTLVSQGEFDALLDLAYNIGAEKVCRFSIIPKFKAGQYEVGCRAILTVDLLNGHHCSRDNNIQRIPGCRGIMNRRNHQYQMCMGVLNAR